MVGGQLVEVAIPQRGEVTVTVPGPDGGPTFGATELFAAGNRDRALAFLTTDEPTQVAPGTYDLHVWGVTPEVWLENVTVSPGQTVGMDLPQRGGIRLAGEAFGVYAAGDRGAPLVEGEAREMVALRPGTYDVAAGAGPAWFEAVEVAAGDIVELAAAPAAAAGGTGNLVLAALGADGEPLAGIVFDVLPEGRRSIPYLPDGEVPLATGTLNQPLALPAGRYDIRVSAEPAREMWGRAVTSFQWIPGVSVALGEEAAVELPPWGAVAFAGLNTENEALVPWIKLYAVSDEVSGCADLEALVWPLVDYVAREPRDVPPGSYVVVASYRNPTREEWVEACWPEPLAVGAGELRRMTVDETTVDGNPVLSFAAGD